jgi:hypothetical protein
MNHWFLKSGERVDDRFNSHVHARIESLIREALIKIDSRGRDFVEEAVDFGRPIGETICVVTDEHEQIVFAKRPRRGGHSRFVLGRQPEPCSSLMLVLKATGQDKREFILITAFVGYKPQPEPWDERYFFQQKNPDEATKKSQEFWVKHALIWGAEDIITGSETSVCPW